ncbi:MAG TPA: histidine phosphatase family protein [Gemmatimonadaceae bacterium]|nr:histidine phosphatase family protein [Gemmatimonadaceae bacterium]
MRLLVIRHAIAEDRDAFATSGRDDTLRPLTDEGRRKMRRAARGLRQLVRRPDALVASPLTRALETAEIVRAEYEMDRVEQMPELAPERSLPDAVAALGRFPGAVVAIVGHEPQLSHLVTFLVTGNDLGALELKKGGACLLEFDGIPKAAAGTLLWAVRPSMLRDLVG